MFEYTITVDSSSRAKSHPHRSNFTFALNTPLRNISKVTCDMLIVPKVESIKALPYIVLDVVELRDNQQVLSYGTYERNVFTTLPVAKGSCGVKHIVFDKHTTHIYNPPLKRVEKLSIQLTEPNGTLLDLGCDHIQQPIDASHQVVVRFIFTSADLKHE